MPPTVCPALRDLMGHASSETTGVYVHHTRDGLERAVAEHQRGGGVLEASAARRTTRRARRRVGS